MKALERIPFMVLVVFSAWLLAGCYTQVGTVRPEGPENSPQEQSTTDDGETYDNDSSQGENEYFDGNGYAEPRYGFNYYYPTFSMGFGYGYYEPWYWRQSLWYSYYDPFWCGTYYPAIYAGWYYPPFGYYYPPYYSGGGYRYTYGGGRGGTTRTIGSTRGSGSVRGDGGTISRGGSSSGGTSLPTGVRSESSVTGRAKEATPRVSTGRKGSDAGSRGGTRGGAGVRKGTTRSGGGKESTPAPRVRREAPARPAPREDRGTQRGGSERSGGGRSYTPPPSPPAQSAPPPAQSAPPANTGARGGNRR